MSERILVLLSGGLDSTTVLTSAISDVGTNNVGAITLTYGQKHLIEVQAAKDVVKYFGIKEHVIKDLTEIFEGTDSTLISAEHAIPETTYEELEKAEGPSLTYVPLRNPVFITVAASMAMIRRYDQLHIGVHAEDARHDAYPDCRSDVIGALGAALHIGSYYRVKLLAPLNHMTKSQVVAQGRRLGAPYHLTHSCYKGERPACGKCPTCIGRLEAFRLNGLIDPITYSNN